MVRWPTERKAPSPIPKLQSLIQGGYTTAFAIGLATGINDREITLLMVGRIEPTDEQRETLTKLVKNFKRAIKLVNAETMKGRL